MTAPEHRMPFSLDWLAEAGHRVPTLTVCPAGHLVVNQNTHWAPTAFADDLHALWCQLVDPCTTTTTHREST